MKRYAVVLENAGTNWGAYVPDLPGCVAVSESREEVRQLIQEAIAFHLERMKQEGLSIPEPLSSSELVEVAA